MRAAVEIFDRRVSNKKPAFIFTCEHASNALPEPVIASPADRQLLDDHWGWDIGAAHITRRLAERCAGVAVLSTQSRLWVDCNRDPLEASWIVREVDGHTLGINSRLDPLETAIRRRTFYDPFHATVDRIIEENFAADLWLVSIHTFTDLYRGVRRDLELGVLFDTYEDEARVLARRLEGANFRIELNEPYSGKEGLIYSIHRAGTKFGLRC